MKELAMDIIKMNKRGVLAKLKFYRINCDGTVKAVE